MSNRTITMTDPLYDYLVQVSVREPPVLRRLREFTQRRPHANMQISPEQGQFMALLVTMLGAKRCIEVGTFTGYSAISIARGLAPEGRLLCCDVSERWTAIARRYFARAGLAERITLRLGPAIDTLRALPSTPDVDLAFVDADKPSYLAYYEALLPRLRPGGLIVFDNVLWMGQVIDATDHSEDTEAIRTLNDTITKDTRVESIMLPVADGLTLARKR